MVFEYFGLAHRVNERLNVGSFHLGCICKCKKIHFWINDPTICGKTFLKEKNDQLNYITAFFKCFELLSFYLFKNTT